MNDIHIEIIDRLNVIKNSLKHKRISFSRVENNEYPKSNNTSDSHLLSIILVGDYKLKGMDENREEITEMVIDIFIEAEANDIKIVADLSYGNGIIIKEEIIEKKSFRNKIKETIDELEQIFFKSIKNEIYNSLDVLEEYKL